MSTKSSDYGAYMEKFSPPLQNPSSSPQLPLHGLTFAVKDIYDVEGYVTGFGNPDWAMTHSAAETTAHTVLALLDAGASCVGKTVMDEMAYSIIGENAHYGTPTNPCAADRVPGGSSSGSAVSVGAKLVDFSLGTDAGGSVRVPSSYCGIFGIRTSHGAVNLSGLIPMTQSFDTVGWFARDPVLLKIIGKILLQSLDANNPTRPSQFLIAEDCYRVLSSAQWEKLIDVLQKTVDKLFGGDSMKHINLGKYIEDEVPSLKCFMDDGARNLEENIPSLAALSTAMRLLQRHEFKRYHGEWVTTVQPKFGPGLSERIWEAVNSTDENIDVCHSVRTELHAALSSMLGDYGIVAIPTVPGPPLELQTEPTKLEIFRTKAFSLLSIAGVSGFCQVSIPLGTYDNLPVSISLLAKHGSDMFLLSLVESIYSTLKENAQSVGIIPFET